MTELDIRLSIYEAFYNNEITEEEKNFLFEKLETNILDKKLFGKMTLYHVSDKKLNIIKPTSINLGTHLSGVRKSSFWSKDLNQSLMWACNYYLNRNNIQRKVLNFKEQKVYVLDICEGKKNGVMSADGKYKYKTTEDLIKGNPYNVKIYRYTLNNVPLHKIGRGHTNIDEYTLDKAVRPDKIEILKYSDFANMIQVCSGEDYEKRCDNAETWGKKDSSLSEKLMFRKKEAVIMGRQHLYDKAVNQQRKNRANHFDKNGNFDPNMNKLKWSK